MVEEDFETEAAEIETLNKENKSMKKKRAIKLKE